MLGGIDPILIFHLWKLTPEDAATVEKIPVVSTVYSKLASIPIPIYLSEKATGLYIDTEEKNIDIETTVDGETEGTELITTQKPINSTVRINLIAKKDSIGLMLLTACADLILPKVTSREYGITYLHGAVTVFNGLLHSFSVTGTSDNELLNISMELSKTTTKTKPPKDPTTQVPGVQNAQSLQTGPLTDAPTKSGLAGPPSSAIVTPPATAAPISIGGQL